MRKPNGQQVYLLDEAEQDQELDEQKVLLKAFCGTLYHYFGGWQKLFLGVRDGRNRELIISPEKLTERRGADVSVSVGSATAN